MPSISYLNKALRIIRDKQCTKGAKLVAKQLLRNSGFTDRDIYDCLKQGSIIRITIFEAQGSVTPYILYLTLTACPPTRMGLISTPEKPVDFLHCAQDTRVIKYSLAAHCF